MMLPSLLRGVVACTCDFFGALYGKLGRNIRNGAETEARIANSVCGALKL
jgi:hypothetical protein